MLALTPVAGELWLQLCPCLLRRRKPCWWSQSFFRLMEEVCWVKNNCYLLNMSARAESLNLFFLPEFFSFLAGLFSWGYLESISRVLEDDCSNAFAFVLTAFSTTSSQKSKFRPRVSNWAQTEGLRPFQNYRIMISLFGVAIGSKPWRTAYRYSRWAAQLRTSSRWYCKSFLIFPQ